MKTSTIARLSMAFLSCVLFSGCEPAADITASSVSPEAESVSCAYSIPYDEAVSELVSLIEDIDDPLYTS